MKLRNNVLAILGICSIMMISCREEGERGESPEIQSEEVETTENPRTTAALNPAHGQPGHTCAIPVGAPLDQANNSSTQQQQQPQNTNTTTSNTSPMRVNSSSATPQKNPPHGQPGHDCAVPVGADLND